MSEALLSVKRLKVSYGGIHAVKGIDFTVNAGEQVTLIGANGAGKTSSLRALTGLQPFEGDILFDGRSIRGMPPHRLLQQGLVMVPEGRGIFTRLTVRKTCSWAPMRGVTHRRCGKISNACAPPSHG